MGARKKLRVKRQISEINMTPLMDLTFILLITFIITFPLLEQGIPIRLPKANAQEVKTDNAQVVAVDAEGKVYLNRQELSLEDLMQRMQVFAVQDPELTVMIRGDETLVYGRIVKVLKTLRAAGVTRTSLVTQQE